MGEGDPQRRQAVVLAVLTEGGMVLLALALGWLLGYPVWGQFDLAPVAFGRGLLLTVPLLVVFAVCVRWPVGPLARIKQFVDGVVKPLFARCSLAELALVALLAGLGEEMLFRGVLQPALCDGFGLWPGLLLASLLFGLAHPITLTYALFATLVGLYLGQAAQAFGGLTEVVTAHAVYDFVALVWLVRGSQ